MKKADITVTNIMHAFNQLIRTSAFDGITVNDIIGEAGVSRATFYRHFRDKYDVMNYNFTALLDGVLSGGKIHTMQDVFLMLLTAGKQSWPQLKSLFNTTGANSLHDHISSYSYTAAQNIYTTGTAAGDGPVIRELTEAEKIQLKIFCHGAALFFEEWVKGKYRLRAEEAAAAMYELLPESLRGELPMHETK